MRRHRLGWMALAAAATIICAAALGPRGALALPSPSNDLDARILADVRLPRVCLGFIAGAALAMGGMAFQALFRNALATPYTIGVSAGASLGAALYVHAGLSMRVVGVPGQPFAAFAGAVVAVAVVYALARRAAGFFLSTLLLAGVAVSFLCTSLILAIQYVADVSTSFRVGRWLVGSLDVVGVSPVVHLLPFVLSGVLVLSTASRDLDLLAIGDESAASRGVRVGRVRHLVLGAAALMVGGVVATCGPIGFVGLVVPHVGRFLVGSRHRALGSFCIFMGGAFLVACDAVGRTVVAPSEIPVGIVTSLVGGPFFLALLVRGESRSRIDR